MFHDRTYSTQHNTLGRHYTIQVSAQSRDRNVFNNFIIWTVNRTAVYLLYTYTVLQRCIYHVYCIYIYMYVPACVDNVAMNEW